VGIARSVCCHAFSLRLAVAITHMRNAAKSVTVLRLLWCLAVVFLSSASLLYLMAAQS
jgi:hypothetical protein